MNIAPSVQGLVAAVTLAMLVGCAGGTSYEQKTSALQNGQIAQFGIDARLGQHLNSFNTCPAKGPIKYLSDQKNSVVSVYVGKFAGQVACGRIIAGLMFPEGLFVKPATHDLYVANRLGDDVLVFHRGATTPYNAYTDPGIQYPVDVTVAEDGTVLASNVFQPNSELRGSISTWVGGPNGGKFIGNFPMTNDKFGLWITVDKKGKVYYTDIDGTTSNGALWSLSCPLGACGAQHELKGLPFVYPGGMTVDTTGDLLANDTVTGGAYTFELPNRTPRVFQLNGSPLGMAIDESDHHWFVADAAYNDAAEYSYPSGTLIGTVPGDPGGVATGVAVDP